MNLDENEQCRLEDIVDSDRVICFFSGNPDIEVPGVFWSVFGDPETNEIVVRANKGSLAYYNSAQSELLYPKMDDRRFGIDVMDMRLAEKLSAALWRQTKAHFFINNGLT